MIDVESIKRIKEEARQEIVEERSKAAKEKLKTKYRQLADAQKIVRNIEGEIETLEADLIDQLI